MTEIKDIKGQRFGKLVVLSYVGQNKFRKAEWRCQCDCGKTTVTTGGGLRSGNTTSCGCYQREANKTHGESRVNSKEYKAWGEMLSRCRNSNGKAYHNYGGRGIKVCTRWLLFVNFLADMGRKPTPQHSLDRYPNNNGNYEPGNCRWATKKQQDTNRRQTRLHTFNGETLCVKDWAKKYDRSYDVLLKRIQSGWDFEKALMTPYKKYKLKRKEVHNG